MEPTEEPQLVGLVDTRCIGGLLPSRPQPTSGAIHKHKALPTQAFGAERNRMPRAPPASIVVQAARLCTTVRVDIPAHVDYLGTLLTP